MPSNYAHYRFGVAALRDMPDAQKQIVSRHRALYDIGLHGPDIFFFNNPVVKNRLGALGSAFHAQSGEEFFGRVCRMLRLQPSQAGYAYLCGVLCHYALDSACHPFVNEHAAQGPCTHVEIESEFDRFLLARDGKCPPHEQCLRNHLRLASPDDTQTVARFYPNVSNGDVRRCLRNMRGCMKLLSLPERPRKAAIGAMKLVKLSDDVFVPMQENTRCSALDAPLLALYDRALAQYPEMLARVWKNLRAPEPFGALFTPDFG